MAAPPNTGKPEQEKQVIRIWDAPESRILFLETILKNKEWEAVIYHPAFSPDGTPKKHTATPLPELSQKLNARGYKTALGQDANGIPILSVRNFGTDTSLATAVSEMGLVKGVARKLSHIGEPLGNAISKTAHGIQYITSDKARLIGGIYMVGNALMAISGYANRKDNALQHGMDPAKMLQNTAGIAAVLQSLIYMGYAKQGSDAMFEQLMEHANHAAKNKQDLLEPGTWQKRIEKNPHGLLHLPKRILEDYPIQLGAALQLAGQMAFMCAGGIRLHRGKGDTGIDAKDIRKGALGDIRTVMLSLAGWALLTKKDSKDITDEDKYSWSDPRRIWQEMSANPNKFASAFFSVASLSGIFAGYRKDNKIQMLANTIYLLGDGIMYTTRSGDYSVNQGYNAKEQAEAAKQFIETSPVILGKDEQKQLVQQLSNYLVESALEEQSRPTTKEAAQNLKESTAKNLNALLPPVNKRANEAAKHIAHVAGIFPPQQAKNVVDSLCSAITDMPGVYIEKDELKSHVQRQLPPPKESSNKTIKMDDVAKPLADLLFALPGAATPQSVNALYSALDKHIYPEYSQTKLEKNINQTALRDLEKAMEIHEWEPSLKAFSRRPDGNLAR